MRLFITDWSSQPTTPLINHCKNTSHKVVGTQLVDTEDVFSSVIAAKPDTVVINYAHKPAKGRAIAKTLRKQEKTALLPIYFINGEEEENEKVAHMGICLSEEEFKELLQTDQPGASLESFLL
ncbi:hypothetical protein [Flavobacterium litorale]|uniref:Response regulatory domain-containing protein n=1 Tax=Flavobacterium litorale TaxID=2856519 RepID=A0ABX8VAZ8_9FLAO|nr:hypothetical protein [Flavobacterium litorale]QYJ68368.1 hypothetical protein K1I41_00320 [Flavobacterium litorale]